MKRDCRRYKRWLDKQKAKGKKTSVFVVYESNSLEMLSNTWWLDSGATVHVINSLQGFKTKRVPNKDDLKVFVGNGERVKVDFIGLVNLELQSSLCLELVDVVYVPTMTRNLLSVSRLVKSNLQFVFDDFGFSISKNKRVVGNGMIVDGMFHLNCKLPKRGTEMLNVISTIQLSNSERINLLIEKLKALDMFKIYKAEVENQLDSKIKVVRSNRGGEFYGKFTEKGRNPGPFAVFLQQEGIVAQYTNLGTPQQNDVLER
ncbi:hypothetical protein L3X38_025737 [Prunus dulcis]|uniref:Retrovirus-related Pol polyprotein from transposon TNT 1-94-like beta-barrel domain-containing protein n=1 Tax=Prunus dulcis TaxID=3755 RepID=A0AAD4Z7P8_PRUDU|nr:hypothetical protein L3X38_025737 [Prunus dulcis]